MALEINLATQKLPASCHRLLVLAASLCMLHVCGCVSGGYGFIASCRSRSRLQPAWAGISHLPSRAIGCPAGLSCPSRQRLGLQTAI